MSSGTSQQRPELALRKRHGATSNHRRCLKAEAYLQTKQYDAAIKDLKKVLNKEPKNENAQRLLLSARQSQK